MKIAQKEYGNRRIQKTFGVYSFGCFSSFGCMLMAYVLGPM